MLSKTLLYLFIITSFVLTSCGSTQTNYRDYTQNKSVKKYKKPSSDHTKNKQSTRNHKSSTVVEKSSSSKRAVQERERLVNYAYSLQGIPYVYGGKSSSGFDCSGFTSYVYKNQGKSLTGNTNMQVEQGRRIPLGQAQKGDLLFFGSSQKISHVALIVENSADRLVVIHATSSKGVIQQDITHSSYWQPKILYGVDILGTQDLSYLSSY